MRYRAKLFSLVAVLCALVLVYLAGRLGSPANRAELLFPGFQPSRSSAVSIAGPAGEVVLSLGPDRRWWIAIEGRRFPADRSKIAAFLEAVHSERSLRIASRDPATWGGFSLERGQAIHVVVRGRGRTLVDLYVGKGAQGGDYVRREGSPATYETVASLSSYLYQAPSSWCDLKIGPPGLSLESLQTIGVRARKFEVGGKSVTADYLLVSTVRGGKTVWTVHGDASYPLDSKRLLDVEAELLGLTGDQFVSHPDPKATGLENPVARVLVTDVEGGRWVIDVGNRDGSRFYVKREDQPYVYLVNQWTLARLIRSLPELSGKG